MVIKALCYTIVKFIRSGFKMTAQSLSTNLKEQVKKGIEILREGGVIAFPTDTVYGIGASIYNQEAVERIYKLKGRPKDMALPVLVANTSQMAEVAQGLPPLACRVIERFLPGGLTLILKKKETVLAAVSAGKDTIAVRIPNNEITLKLIEGLGAPIIGTSANKKGGANPLSAQQVKKVFCDSLDLIIDGGKVSGGVESSIVDFSGDNPKLLREGAISRSELELACRIKYEKQ
jgi:L-threonylcarbamoyladenylate synthase